MEQAWHLTKKRLKNLLILQPPFFFLGGGRSAYYKAMEVDLF